MAAEDVDEWQTERIEINSRHIAALEERVAWAEARIQVGEQMLTDRLLHLAELAERIDQATG